jgi:homoserine kinase
MADHAADAPERAQVARCTFLASSVEFHPLDFGPAVGHSAKISGSGPTLLCPAKTTTVHEECHRFAPSQETSRTIHYEIIILLWILFSGVALW